MLSRSKIKPIILCTIIPILVFILWSLTNNNNNDLIGPYVKTYPIAVEVHKIEESTIEIVEMIQPVKLPTITYEEQIIALTRKEQIKCMAVNIYHEAGGEPYMGQVAVARVVMNRVLHGFASNPCKVIYQMTTRWNPNTERSTTHCQFSWVCQHKKEPHKDNPIYVQAEEIARQILDENKWKDEISSDLLFFHNNKVNPRWPYYEKLIIGNHVFYSKTK
jgi:spore germination cell wall hydrolase CwlJ-like protein